MSNDKDEHLPEARRHKTEFEAPPSGDFKRKWKELISELEAQSHLTEHVQYSMQNVSQEDQSWSAFVSELEATIAEQRSTIAGLENSLKRTTEELAQAHRAIERLVERGANAYLHERIQALERDRADADIELADAHGENAKLEHRIKALEKDRAQADIELADAYKKEEA